MAQLRRQPGIAGLLLAAQLMNVGLENIPAVTLATLGLNAGIFYGILDRLVPAAGKLFDPDAACVSLKYVLHQEDWKRLLLAGLVHADELHLYYNMISFLWKGRMLEQKLGSLHFACLLIVFTPLINVVMLLLNYVLGEYVMDDHEYFFHCAVGFSGVIFALKVLATYDAPPGSIDQVAGFLVPSRYACWVELGLIQLVTPNASFAGHLAGIIVGLLYVWGPLRAFIASLVHAGPSYSYAVGSTGATSSRTGGRSQFWGSGLSGRQQQQQPPPPQPRNSYDEYTGGMSEQEQLRRATLASMPQSQPSAGGYGWGSTTSYFRSRSGGGDSANVPDPTAAPSAPPYPVDEYDEGDLERLRQRRTQRFQ